MKRSEFYATVSGSLKLAGYFSAVVGKELHVYGSDDYVTVFICRNVVTIDGKRTDWNKSFIENMAVLSCTEIIDLVFEMFDHHHTASDVHKVNAVNADYDREKCRMLTRQEYTYYNGYMCHYAEREAPESRYNVYAIDNETGEMIMEYHNIYSHGNRLFMKGVDYNG